MQNTQPAEQFPPAMLAFLQENGLAQATAPWQAEPLTGGVASDIWRFSQNGASLCIKQALGRLKVEQVWEVPVERNQYEVAWFQTAARWAPQAVPEVLAADSAAGIFAMEYLPAEAYPVWKRQLAAANVEQAVAQRLGDILGRIHAGTAGDPAVAQRFATDELFYPIRIEPYLIASARVNLDVAPVLYRLATSVLQHKKTLVHGDVSPKNILVGPHGPVILDAECAWYGDPAFDVAFLLNHLLLKCIWVPNKVVALMDCFAAFWQVYRARINWEAPDELEARVSALLPGLFLARIDGKSPVEYITVDEDKATVRRFAYRLLRKPAIQLATLRSAWLQEMT